MVKNIFWKGEKIEGAQEVRDDGENFVILASGNFPGCSGRKIIYPKNEVNIEEIDQSIFIDWK